MQGRLFMSITIGERPLGPVRADLKVAFPESAFLGEGPVWSAAERKLYWVDILGAVRADQRPRRPGRPARSASRTHRRDGAPGRRGGFVAAMQGGFKAVDLTEGVVTTIANPEFDRPGNRFNDGKCDRKGRFWAGSLAIDTTPSAGSLYRLDPDGRVSVMETGIHVSNGLGWSPDDTRFYFTDSGRREIFVYDFDPRAAPSKTAAPLPECPKAPARRTA